MSESRPGIVTFVVVLTYINAALYAVSSLVAFFLYGADATREDIGLSAGVLLGTGIGYAIVAIVMLFVGMSLARGNRTARTLVAIAMGLGIVVAIAAMILHHTAAYIGQGIGTLAFNMFILWALYGNDKADAYFEKLEA
mgnify:CR=1 FL=1